MLNAHLGEIYRCWSNPRRRSGCVRAIIQIGVAWPAESELVTAAKRLSVMLSATVVGVALIARFGRGKCESENGEL